MLAEVLQPTEEFELYLTDTTYRISHDSILQNQVAPENRTEFEELSIPQYGITAFRRVWDHCFGEAGYLNSADISKTQADKETLMTAYVLAEYGHQKQKRGTGE